MPLSPISLSPVGSTDLPAVSSVVTEMTDVHSATSIVDKNSINKYSPRSSFANEKPSNVEKSESLFSITEQKKT
ncbi:hypothetical protein [Providencia burhodogranariea]|uniref:Uncharacterized protein n=1 Tax=Providencia burhodogranariea DSM 19968 TaxID=1141662 RepID=K8WVI6_9GAMM|nr:hypothetical protein [Providencia burhodogranariea]EKT64613.1 hypothetical protein OOA_02412 [Providencia burhodogranariea DSM 19968]